MRIVFMGTPDFSVETLRALVKAGHEVAGVATQPDKPKGRGKALAFSPVKEAALELGLPVYQPRKAKDPEFIRQLRELSPEAVVVVAFGQLLPGEILELPPLGCLNVHASLLPKYRGAAPIQQAVLNGDPVSGVTIMRMDEGLDTGDMIAKAEIPLEEGETGGSLFEKLSSLGAKLLVETLEEIQRGTAVYTPQPKESPTPYAAMIKKEQGRICWEEDADRIERLVRGMNPWPSAFTYSGGKMLKIWECKAISHCPFPFEGRAPGEVLGTDKDGIYVRCGGGALRLLQVQLEGKKRMDAGAFLRGYPLLAGSAFSKNRENEG